MFLILKVAIIFINFGLVLANYACFSKPATAQMCYADDSKLESTIDTQQIELHIKRALKRFQPCSNSEQLDSNCSCHVATIARDLEPYVKLGITRKMIKATAIYGVRYTVYNGRLYRQRHCHYPERCAGVEYFLLKIVRNLPNLEFVLRLHDWPQIHFLSGLSGPIFSYSKTAKYLDIMYPAWSFWWNGPQLLRYPNGIGRWDLMREHVGKMPNNWHEKLSVGFFRGARTSTSRDTLILLSRKKPDLVQAAYTVHPLQKKHNKKDTLDAPAAADVSIMDHCKFKYLFNYPGVAASFRLRHLFLCKSLVFHVGNKWLEFFYEQLKPWVHYVPVKEDANEADLEAILLYFREHDELAQQIAERGYSFIWQHLRMQDIQCYFQRLLDEYGKLMKYKVTKNSKFVEISVRDVALYHSIWEGRML